MASISSLSDACRELLLDASVVVNLNATGYADRILSALPIDVLVPKPVIKELENGAQNGHQDATDLADLLDRRIVSEAKLVAGAQSEFIALTAGSAISTLGDGEAATIACAHATGAWAAIDERKAWRICRERYKPVTVVSTVDILAHGHVENALSHDEMSKAVLAALEVANMHVHPHHLNWVINWIDETMLHRCKSLPRAVRDGRARAAKTAS